MNQDPQVLIVSSGSNGVSRFLLTQLVEQYPSINFSGPIYEAGYKQLENIKELVVLTNVNERLDELRPVLKINDIVTSEDLRNIDKFLQLHGVATTASFTTEYKSLMDIISDNATIKNSEALEKGVKQILLNKKNHNKRKERRRQPLLSEVLTTDMIKFSDSQSLDWRQAFELSAQPLLKTGKITHEYIEAILKNVDDNGPYMNIGPEIALAHARPDQGVNQLGMSLLKLDKDIDLVDDKHRIRLIIVLAAVDSTTHLKALSELAQILGSKKDVDLIMKAKNAFQIENLILEGEKQ